ncbi:MAG: radical SAM protein [Deltaproteobacteria bacterium]|nr:radical SAM protein [Deltaproteobacteria bacterium]
MKRNNVREIETNSRLNLEIQALHFPDRITVELTNHCNLECVMCPREHMTGSKGYMEVALFRKIVDEMVSFGRTALVPFFRGETLLHPRWIEMLGYAKERGIGPIQFATNATLMSEKAARALLDLELDFVSFSLDSIDPDIYRTVRRGAELEVVLRNIEVFCDLKKRRKIDKPEIQVSVVRTENTASGVEDFVAYWSNRVDRVRVYEQHSRDGRFGSLKKESGSESCETRTPCFKPFRDMVIYWNGRVALCNHDWDRIRPLGDVNVESMERIWRGDAYRRVRKAHIDNGDGLDQPCSGCDHWRTFSEPERKVGELFERMTERG